MPYSQSLQAQGKEEVVSGNLTMISNSYFHFLKPIMCHTTF